MTPLCEWSFERTPSPFCSLQYHNTILFFKAAGKQRMGPWYVKIPPSSLVAPWIAESFCFFSEFWKSWLLTVFARFLVTFVERQTLEVLRLLMSPYFLECYVSKKSKHIVPIVFNKQIILLYIHFSFWDFVSFAIAFPLSLISLALPNASFSSANVL